MALDRLALPREINVGDLLAGFLVPGCAVWLRGPSLWGRAALAASGGLMLMFIAWLGYPVANFAFGLLLSLHVTGLVYYCNPLMAHQPFRVRLAFTFLVLLGLGLLLYLPARDYLQGHWVTPLRINGRVVVVWRHGQADRIRRGDWVAYALSDPQRGGPVRVQAGASLGPVLAVAGDRLQFATNSFSVNGNWHTNQPYMPVTGGFVVPENQWFIWPRVGISGHGDVGELNIRNALWMLARVNENQFLGKPLHHWFGRKQLLP